MTRPTELNYVTCEFATPGSWAAGYHTGIDYRAPVGTPIYATRGGKVIHAGWGGTYGPAYGNYVVIRTWDGRRFVQHLYAHLSHSKVKEYQRVSAGDVIGLGGDTGNTNGPHLHYEERTYPFDYWQHRPPKFPAWQPTKAKFLNNILKKIGVRK